jgi:hypothetical protein
MRNRRDWIAKSAFFLFSFGKKRVEAQPASVRQPLTTQQAALFHFSLSDEGKAQL